MGRRPGAAPLPDPPPRGGREAGGAFAMISNFASLARSRRRRDVRRLRRLTPACGRGPALRWSRASASAPAEFGVALTVMTVLYLAAMSAAGALAERFGVAPQPCWPPLLAMGPALALLVAARSPLWLGAGAGVVRRARRPARFDDERRRRARRAARRLKPIFAQFHALASGTTAAGAAIGGWLAFKGYGWVAASFIVEAALLDAAADGGARDRRAAGRRRAARRRGAEPRAIDAGLAVLGLAIGVSIVCETSALSWAALLLRNTAPSLRRLRRPRRAFFAAFQSAMRFGIDRLRRTPSATAR